MTIPADDPANQARCGCNSGLLRGQCCGLDWSTTEATAAPGAELEPIRAELRVGNLAGSGERLVELLTRHPLDIAALRLLRDVRTTEGRPVAAEVLNARIVRLDPNDLGATQAL